MTEKGNAPGGVRRAGAAALLAVILGLASVSGAQESAENFVVYGIGGERRIFHKMTAQLPAGGVMMVNFTSVDCLPCRKEIPELDALRKAHGGKVTLVCVFSETGEPVRKLATELGVLDAAHVDPLGAIRTRFNVKSIPTTILVGRDNGILGRFVGYTHKNMNEIRRLVK